MWVAVLSVALREFQTVFRRGPLGNLEGCGHKREFSPLPSSNLTRRPLLGVCRVCQSASSGLGKNLQSPVRDGQDGRWDDATHSTPARVPFSRRVTAAVTVPG